MAKPPMANASKTAREEELAEGELIGESSDELEAGKINNSIVLRTQGWENVNVNSRGCANQSPNEQNRTMAMVQIIAHGQGRLTGGFKR